MGGGVRPFFGQANQIAGDRGRRCGIGLRSRTRQSDDSFRRRARFGSVDHVRYQFHDVRNSSAKEPKPVAVESGQRTFLESDGQICFAKSPVSANSESVASDRGGSPRCDHERGERLANGFVP